MGTKSQILSPVSTLISPLPDVFSGDVAQDVDCYQRGPLVQEVCAKKNTLVYRVHSYPTKVPHQAIQPFIEHFTNPGDLVLDPFCGSGMTGVAAIASSRNAILSDISPAALHIAANYVTPCDHVALRTESERILACLDDEISSLYWTTCDRCKEPATIEYTVWSDIFRCMNCRKDFSYWEAAVDLAKGSVRTIFPCPHCDQPCKKQGLQWKSTVPVATKYSCRRRCGRLVERPITAEEKLLSSTLEAQEISEWYPKHSFGRDREMWRKSHEVMGIHTVDGFYTKRNLRALSAFWREINRLQDHRLKAAVQFVFTAVANRASRRYQWNAKRPTNVQTGTLYISSLNYEWNVRSLFRRKLRDIVEFYKESSFYSGSANVIRDSATKLSKIQDESIDYIFTDPPFGGNIYYSDCAILWESWLHEFTDNRDELVINHKRKPEHGGKNLQEYQKHMTQAFRRMQEVLKPGRWASVVFHSGNPKVWRAIQDGLKHASLEFGHATALDKGQPSIKGVKGLQDLESVPAVDVILHVCKTRSDYVSVPELSHRTNIEEIVLHDLKEHLANVPTVTEARIKDSANVRRRTQYLHNLAVRSLLNRKIPFSVVSFEYVEKLCKEHFVLRDGHWWLPGQAAEDGLLEQQLFHLPCDA